jgi:subtilisin family serine protease
MTRLASLLAVGVVSLAVVSGSGHGPVGLGGSETEVVVLLDSPSLALSPDAGPTIEREQRTFLRELGSAVPAARVGWRYRIVANGFSVTLRDADLPRVRALPGVSEVLPSATYGERLDRTPGQIGAPLLWGPGLETAGQGIKIGIIDSGVDAEHPFFDPAGYKMPPGFPKGQKRFTTAKVVVARSFPPSGSRNASARLAFDEDESPHGTHVAGIAAGNAETPADGRVVSGVAPRAYIGNYRVFVPTPSGISPNANSPAIVAAIEAAVRDGMNVVNFSGGEPEIEPSRDIVARALDAAAAAGVVPVVAAGNDYNDFGAGSVSSPANSASAIAVAAVEIGGSPVKRVHASFSSVGPTTISLRLKPDVAAPGVDVRSSIPGGWAFASGTSMATPHVAGAAALLVQRHPAWTPEQVKSALVQTGSDAVDEDGKLVGPRFVGGGVVALGRADEPLLFARPTAVSLGLLERGSSSRASIDLADAGGAGTWEVAKVVRTRVAGVQLTVPTTATVPGSLELAVAVGGSAPAGDLEGYVELRRGKNVRRIPYWGRVTAAALARHKTLVLERPGRVRGTTAGQTGLVSRYRYPESPSGVGVTTVLRGPERVYTLRLAKPVANFGVVITSRSRGARVEPRVVAGLDENRLTGVAALPVTSNPYLDQFHEPVPSAGALSPLPGSYAVVFDSPTRAGAGRFTFRYWVNDVTPPVVRLKTRAVDKGRPLKISATDAGSGVYPQSIIARVDGARYRIAFKNGVVSIATGKLEPGTHRLSLRVSDYQEAKNTENVARILPNTRTLTTTFRVRR